MLTIFADNTMILGSIADRQDMPVVTTSTISRGLERLVVRVLRAVVPVYAHASCAAAGCRRFSNLKPWQSGLSGNSPLGTGLPVGSGHLNLRTQIAG